MSNQATKAKQYMNTLEKVRWLHAAIARPGTPCYNMMGMYAHRLAQRMTEKELARWEELTDSRLKLFEDKAGRA